MYEVITPKEFCARPWLYDEPLDTIWIAKSGKNKKSYLQLYCGFDIETYTTPSHYAYMWIWQFSIYGQKETIIIGRTWSEFVKVIDTLIDDLNLSKERRIICGIANLSFEHQFMKKHFIGRWTKTFAKEARQPLYVMLDNCIEFRDVLMITGGSLATLAKEYCRTPKLVGDLDYTVPRTYKTPLHSEKITDSDLQYCYNDVIIVAEFMEYLFNNYIIPDKWVPLTKTGLLRREVKKEIASFGSGVKREIYNEVYRCYIPTEKLYKLFMQYLFRGGYTHANLRHVGKVVEGVKSVDFTSSYPYTMLSYDGFPVSPLKRERVSDFWKLYNSGDYCLMFSASFTNLRATTDHAIESESKCVTIPRNAIIDNGRVRACNGTLEVLLTEIDLNLYRMFYKWGFTDDLTEGIKINWVYSSLKGRLPKYLLKPLAKAYEEKARMKHNGMSDTPEYALKKSLINSAFGMCCTRQVEFEVCMSDISCEWYLDGTKYNYNKERQKAFLLPQWGIYICARSRERILQGIYNMRGFDGAPGKDACYSDTDSIKYIGDHDAYIEAVNKETEKTMQKVCKLYDLDFDLFHDLGSFEKEYGGKEVQAKFLGAKRYIIKQNGEYKVTIAGLPKNSLTSYVNRLKLQKEIYDYGEYPELFDIFSDKMLLDAEVSLKNAHTYNDEPHTSTIEGVQCYELSSVGIYPIDFTMKLSEFYLMLIASELERSEHLETRIY